MNAIRIQNRSAVLRLLHREDHDISRRAIARRTGLDASTVTHIINEFIAGGLVRERGVAEPNGAPRRGRREISLELISTAAYAIGVHLGVRSIRVAACDLRGQIVARRAALLVPGSAPDVAIAEIVSLVESILSEATLDQNRVVGVGVGAIAFLDPEAGVIRSAPSLGWGKVAITKLLAERIKLPILLEHHVRAMALAEQWFGHACAVRNFALINVDSSVGVGTVVDGKVVLGDNWRAGQIAHMVVQDDGPLCTCGRHGCLVMLASYRAIARRVEDTVRQNPHSALAHAVAENPDVPAEHTAFDLARQGDPLALMIVEEAAGYVALAITYLASLVDPELIVLAAANADHAEILLEPIRERVVSRAPLNPSGTLRIVTSALGRDVAVLGAASLALENFMAAPTNLPVNTRTDLVGVV